jgi:hypothetical protein
MGQHHAFSKDRRDSVRQPLRHGHLAVFSEDPEKAENFNRYMAASSEHLNQAISSEYDFSPYKKLIDVGGGIGGMISAILEKNPDLNGAIYDAPTVVEQAKGFLASKGLSDRCETIAGDFFQSVPAGGDIYSMRWILHDWEDSKSITILENIKKVLPANGKLVAGRSRCSRSRTAAFQQVLRPHHAYYDRRPRTHENEWRVLLEKAGYRIERIIPTVSFPQYYRGCRI